MTNTYGQSTRLFVKITDSFGTPVPKATASLQNAETKAVVKHAATDSTGACIFLNLLPGKYFVTASSVGYSTAQAADFEIMPGMPSLSLEDIKLRIRAGELAGVTVVATKPLIQALDDKIVYNVDNDPSLAGLSASEALAKVPFISVDGNGGVQVKGQSSFQILLNGKQTSMFASNMAEVLKSFPASMISKIEVITNPSAKYEGEGITGLINIITKKKVAGYNGSTSFNYNSLGQINPNLSFNLKKGKTGITSFVYYARNTGFDIHGSKNYQSLNDSAAYARRSFADHTHNAGYMAGGNLEISYEPDSTQAISLYGRMTNGGNSSNQNSDITTTAGNGNIIGQSNFATREKADLPGGEVGADYLKQFKKKGNNLSAGFNYQYRQHKSAVNSDQQNSINEDRTLLNNSKAKNRQAGFQLDYTHLLTKSTKLETGMRIISRQVNSHYSSQVKNPVTGIFVPDPQNTNELKYSQDVIGIYGVITYTVPKKITVKAGLRLEKTNVNGHFISSNTAVKQDYYSLLPSFSINRTLKKNRRLTLAYNRRLARPGLTFLNPFIDNRDPLFTSYGNEKLKPEFANNAEFSFASFSGKINYSIAINASFLDGNIQRYFIFNEVTGKTEQTFGNIGKSKLAGFNGFISYSPNDKFSASVNLSLNYASIKNTMNIKEKGNGIYGSVNSSINYTASDRLSFFNNINYSMAPVQLQGRNGDNLFYNLGASYWLYQKKLSMYIGGINFFDKYWKNESEFRSANLYQQTVSNRPMRALAVGLRFNFGKLKENTSRKKGIAIDDSKADVNGN
jgi:outer membrane receptor protein involved in Fe transport